MTKKHIDNHYTGFTPHTHKLERGDKFEFTIIVMTCPACQNQMRECDRPDATHVCLRCGITAKVEKEKEKPSMIMSRLPRDRKDRKVPNLHSLLPTELTCGGIMLDLQTMSPRQVQRLVRQFYLLFM